MSYEDRKSTWNSGVRKVIRLGRRSAEEEVRKHQDRLTGAWKQISKQRRRVFASYAPSMVTALQHGTWMDGEGLKKKLYQGQEKKVRHPPASLRYMGSRLHAETGCRKVFVLGMYLSDQKIPWQRRRQSRMAVAGNTQTASFLTKIGKMQSAGCRLCRIALEVRDESTDGLAAETHGHIKSAGCCEGMITTVTAAHLSIWRNLYDSMHAARMPKSNLLFVTLNKKK